MLKILGYLIKKVRRAKYSHPQRCRDYLFYFKTHTQTCPLQPYTLSHGCLLCMNFGNVDAESLIINVFIYLTQIYCVLSMIQDNKVALELLVR